MRFSRRQFVAQSSGLLFSLAPYLDLFTKKPDFVEQSNKILVRVHLAGGNDWFNTIIPYRDSDYYHCRPNLAIPKNEIIPLNESVGLHPSMSAMQSLWNQKKLSLLTNQDSSTLCHHKAIEINQIKWKSLYTRLIEKIVSNNLVFPAINVEPFSPQNQMIVSSLSPENGFVFNLDVHYRLEAGRSNRADSRPPLLQKTQNCFADGLNLIAEMITKNTNAPIYNISLGGFDTHSNQLERHALLLHMLSEAILSFQQDLDKHGLADRVLIVIQSEFGRSLKENDEAGTDHGFTNHILVVGNSAISNNEGFSDFITDRLLYRLG